jgi:hypothetical protein
MKTLKTKWLIEVLSDNDDFDDFDDEILILLNILLNIIVGFVRAQSAMTFPKGIMISSCSMR